MANLRVIQGQLRVIQGQKDEATHVCTWCGQTFVNRISLEAHWSTDPRCKRNRYASNQTQTKYGGFGVIQEHPGEPTLRQTRVKDCVHPAAELQYLQVDSAGQIVYQCNHCYSEIKIGEVLND